MKTHPRSIEAAMAWMKSLYIKYAPEAAKDPYAPNHWKEKVLYLSLLVSVFVVFFVLVAGMPVNIENEYWLVSIAAVTGYLGCLLLFFCPKARFQIRATVACSLIYFLGITLILDFGPFLASREYLFTFSIMASILLGWTGAAVSITINLITLIAVGILIENGYWPNLLHLDNALLSWHLVAIDLVFINIISTLLIALFFMYIDRSHQAATNYARLLLKEGKKLTDSNQQLALEIEDRKAVAKALEASEERYRLLAENSSDVIWSLALDGKVTYVSPSVRQWIGFTPEEFLELPLEKRMPAESLGELLRRLSAELSLPAEQRTSHDILEIEQYAKDGSIKKAEMSISWLFDSLGRPVGLQGATRDITQRKQAEALLRKSEEKYRTILETIEEAYFESDLDGRLVFFNRALSDWLAYTGAELMGCHYAVCMDAFNADKFRVVLSNVLASGKSGQPIDLEILSKSGKAIAASILISLLTDEQGNPMGFRALARDMTQYHTMALELQRAQKMEAVGTLAGGVAHDLNNILSGVVSYPELLLLNMADDDPLRKPVLTIKKSGERAVAIVQDLLTLARRGVSVKEVVNLNLIVKEYLLSTEFQHLKSFHRGISVETELAPNLPNVNGSPVHLSKTVMNLVSNAAEAISGEGSIYLSTQEQYIESAAALYDNVREGEYVVLTIRDTGIGIAPGDLGKIFEPFFTKKVMGRSGTGLGMAVVWGTVKDHGGYINVHSAQGKGTTFTIYLPITRLEAPKHHSTLSIEAYKGQGETILIVDDVETQREIATGILEKLNYKPVSVPSGELAIDYLKTQAVDLLLLDMIMEPGLDGLETYKRILAMHPGQKAVIASGYSETERIKETQRLGAGQYIRKPYSIEKLGVAIRKELDGLKAPDALS